MWEEETTWLVEWSGKTIWDDYFSDSEYFDNEQKALEFCVKLGLDERNYYINLNKSIVWRKKV